MKVVQIRDKALVDEMLEIENECFSLPWTKGMIEAEFDKDFAFYIGVFDGDRLIGYGGFWKILDEGHITNIAVRKEYRRRGIGDTIVCEIKSLCREMDIERITLEVRKSNGAAIRLYEKAGFVAVGVRKAYYEDNGEDAVIMWLEV